MRKLFAVLTTLLVLSASAIPVFAGGQAYHSSQRRARAKADTWNKKITDKWEMFDAEMDVRNKNSTKATPKANDGQR